MHPRRPLRSVLIQRNKIPSFVLSIGHGHLRLLIRIKQSTLRIVEISIEEIPEALLIRRAKFSRRRISPLGLCRGRGVTRSRPPPRGRTHPLPQTLTRMDGPRSSVGWVQRSGTQHPPRILGLLGSAIAPPNLR
jgi:hypothetical protein